MRVSYGPTLASMLTLSGFSKREGIPQQTMRSGDGTSTWTEASLSFEEIAGSWKLLVRNSQLCPARPN
ncbi:hypothetical protein ASE79_05300 [Sphingomonas sp. Leaf28]|nr:hypothetical protein ASE79_05300 [Sphingomonas sp. Leaf28]